MLTFPEGECENRQEAVVKEALLCVGVYQVSNNA